MSLPQLLFCTPLRFSLPPLEHPSIPKLPWQDSSGDADKLSGRGGSFLSRRLLWTHWNLEKKQKKLCDAASLSLSKFELILPMDHEVTGVWSLDHDQLDRRLKYGKIRRSNQQIFKWTKSQSGPTAEVSGGMRTWGRCSKQLRVFGIYRSANPKYLMSTDN